MIRSTRAFLRHASLLLSATALLLQGCGSTSDSGTGSITLSLASASSSVVQGGSGTVTATVVRSGGFTGDVNISLEGLPANLTGVVSNVTTTGTTTSGTATFTVGDNVTAATYPIVIRATGSGVTASTATYTLTVTLKPVSTYTIAVNTGALSVLQGSSANATITMTRTNFTNSVNLSLAGAPAGVSATFSPNDLSGTATVSTMTLNVLSSAPVGTYPLTITGVVSGVATNQTVPLVLTVGAAGTFTINSLTAASLAIGGTAPITINVSRATGFITAVNLTATGLPTGLTATFSPASVAGTTSALTFAAATGTVLGTYGVVIHANATGVAEQTSTIQVTVLSAGSFTLGAVSAATLPLSGTTPVAITMTRTADFTPSVALSVSGLPTGVTGTFVPSSTTGTTSTLTLGATGAVTLGTYTVTVRATVPGLTDQTKTFTLTVGAAGNFSIALGASGASFTAGNGAAPVVTLTRVGGFTGDVSLSTSTLPSGLSASFAPTAFTGAVAASTLTFTSTSGLAAGVYPIVVKANATGLSEQTATYTVTVTAGGGGSGNVTLNFANCAATAKPIWFAVQDGSGSWTRVTGTSDAYSFTVTSNKGGYMYVTQNGTSTTVIGLMETQAELTGIAPNICAVAGKTVTGTATGFSGLFDASFITLGGGSGSASVSQSAFTLNNVAAGNQDLVAYRYNVLTPGASDRGLLRRDQNIASGGALASIDFNGAESFAPQAATVTTVNGVLASTIMFYLTGSTCSTSVLTVNGTGSTTVYGVPAANQRASDFHELGVTSTSGNVSKTVLESFHAIGNRTVTFGATPAAPAITSLGGAYKRLQAVFTMPADYPTSGTFQYQTSSATSQAVSIGFTSGWLGGSSATIAMPDFSGLAGWNSAWAPATGATVTTSLALANSNVTVAGLCSEGAKISSVVTTGTN